MDQHADQVIDPKYRAMMNDLARLLDSAFNGEAKGDDRKNGFVLLVFPFDEVGGKGRSNYISNANRPDIVVMLKELLARWQGQPEVSGRA